MRSTSRHEINLEVHLLIFFKMTDDQGLLKCVSCREVVGINDGKESYSLRLFKWSLALQRSRGLDWETCSVQEIISAQLLALTQEQAVYKFLAYSGDIEYSTTALMVSTSSRTRPNIHILELIETALGIHPRSDVLNVCEADAARNENILHHSHGPSKDTREARQ